jgi:hypothetical protein
VAANQAAHLAERQRKREKGAGKTAQVFPDQ